MSNRKPKQRLEAEGSGAGHGIPTPPPPKLGLPPKVGLEAALDLSDGTSSIVVLQGGSGAWASFLPSVLVGQRTVLMLRQKADEPMEELCARVDSRLGPPDRPTHRILWVTPPYAAATEIAQLRRTLQQFCETDREVLLVWGEEVEMIDGVPRVSAAPPVEPVRPRGSAPRAPDRSDVHWDAPGAGAGYGPGERKRRWSSA